MTPQEELAALRHLIEKQQKEIAEKELVRLKELINVADGIVGGGV